MDSPRKSKKSKVGNNRNKEPVPPPPPPPMQVSMPACSQHSAINRTPSDRSNESAPINIISEEVAQIPTRKPYFDTINFERPRLIRRDADKVCRLYSGMYGRIVIVFTIAFVLTEILNKTYSPYFFQGFLFLYLFGVSILCMMIIYCYLLRLKIKDSSSDSKKRRTGGLPEISVYLRTGALLFGLGTLLFNGLEVAIVFMTEKRCTNMPGMALPILQAFFTFVQMHFIFTDCRRALRRLGWFSWFAMSHLAATNLAVWVRIVVMETASDWLHHLPEMTSQLQSNDPDMAVFSNSSMEMRESLDEAMKLFICLHNSTLGNVWEDSMPYLYPFIIKFSWLGCAIFYTMRSSLGSRNSSNHSSSPKDDNFSMVSKKRIDTLSTFTKTGRKHYFRIDCRGSSKGLFAGLFLLIGNIIVVVLFFVLRAKKSFEYQIYFATLGSYGAMLLLALIGVLIGYIVVRNNLSESFHKTNKIDEILSTVNLTGLCLLCAFSLVISGSDITDPLKMILVASSCLTILQATMQEMYISEMSGRKSSGDSELGLFSRSRPGRQITTFLLFVNIILWMYDTFVTYIILLTTNHMHVVFMSSFPWGIIFRVCLPLLIFYRFHSAVRLMSLWKSTYEQ